MNERTSARIARIAGKVLALNITDDAYGAIGSDGSFGFIDAHRVWHEFKWSDIRALAGSALTQAPNKKRKPIRSPAKRASKPKCKPDHPSFPKFKRKVHAPFLRSGNSRDHLAKKAKRK